MSRTAWKRPARSPLGRGVPVAVVLDLDDDDPYGAFQRRLDDAWARELLRLPFSWQVWVDWHAVRRWVRPDDPRHEPAERRAIATH